MVIFGGPNPGKQVTVCSSVDEKYVVGQSVWTWGVSDRHGDIRSVTWRNPRLWGRQVTPLPIVRVRGRRGPSSDPGSFYKGMCSQITVS